MISYSPARDEGTDPFMGLGENLQGELSGREWVAVALACYWLCGFTMIF